MLIHCMGCAVGTIGEVLNFVGHHYFNTQRSISSNVL